MTGSAVALGLTGFACGSATSTHVVSTTTAVAPTAGSGAPVPTPRPPHSVAAHPISRKENELRRQLRRGSVAFTSPAALHLGEPAEIALVVGLGSLKHVAAALPYTDQKHAAHVELADRMQASLTGIGFRIDPETAPVQPINVLDTTEWRWEIKPTTSGRLRLHLTLTALLRSGGETQSVSIRTFDRTIAIDVPFDTRVTSFFGGNWQWLISTFLLPLAAYVWHRRRRPGEPGPDAPPARLEP